MRTTQLPPGPRLHPALQMLGMWSRPTAFLDRCRARYGSRFTIRLPAQSPIVMISEPEEIKQLFTAPPEVLHPGEGARILEPLVGANSVILLDEQPHLEQRKLMLPAFHGERMQSLAAAMSEVVEQEVRSWPRDQPCSLHPRLQRLALEIILRAVFGLQSGPRLSALRELLPKLLAFGESPISLVPRPPEQPRLLALVGPIASFERSLAKADELVYELIEERRSAAERHSAGAEGDDVLAMLLAARHEDGSPMSPAELRDELMTALVAGHETTASQLAWAFSRLAREPRVVARIREELDMGDGDEYLTATIYEVMRMRPVLPSAEPRLVKQPVRIGPVCYPPGVALFPSAYLVHHDPAIYERPREFRPERFLEQPPGTYTWIPFGGGRRRCLGASFAMLEMKIALRTVLERVELQADGQAGELARRRSITLSPSRGARVLLRDRAPRGRSAGVPPSLAAA